MCRMLGAEILAVTRLVSVVPAPERLLVHRYQDQPARGLDQTTSDELTDKIRSHADWRLMPNASPIETRSYRACAAVPQSRNKGADGEIATALPRPPD